MSRSLFWMLIALPILGGCAGDLVGDDPGILDNPDDRVDTVEFGDGTFLTEVDAARNFQAAFPYFPGSP